MADIKEEYTSRYITDKRVNLYPVEFVVRAFLGTYPGLNMPRGNYQGKKILDLGYGDGRNMSLLHNLGFSIGGVEITDSINEHTAIRLKSIGIEADLRTGANHYIPFPDQSFQYVLACHACYYIEPGTSFDDNLREISRVLEAEGYFISSLPMSDTYILKDAEVLGDGYYRIQQDPYGLRDGTIFRAFNSQQEVEETFSPYFKNFSIGFCDDLFWGIHQKVWIVVCQKLAG